MKQINCFVVCNNILQTRKTVQQLTQSTLVKNVYLLIKKGSNLQIDGCLTIEIDSIQSSETIKMIGDRSDTNYSLIYIKDTILEPGQYALERYFHIAEGTGAGLVYADYYQIINQERTNLPLIDYQKGSLRDDFNFGSVLFYSAVSLKKAILETTDSYQYAGLYNLRLKVSQQAELIHINEYLYTEIEADTRKSGEKQFDYVDPKNRAVQIEMEAACTVHLKNIGGYLAPEFKAIAFDESKFPVEASVIIPIRNRVRTVEDAI